MTNIADPSQVKERGLKVKFKREAELSDIRFILSTEQGRRFIWRLLEEAKVFESIWHSSALIHYNSGKQDFGHFILGEITEAKEDAFIQMMNEIKRKKKMEEQND